MLVALIIFWNKFPKRPRIALFFKKCHWSGRKWSNRHRLRFRLASTSASLLIGSWAVSGTSGCGIGRVVFIDTLWVDQGSHESDSSSQEFGKFSLDVDSSCHLVRNEVLRVSKIKGRPRILLCFDLHLTH